MQNDSTSVSDFQDQVRNDIRSSLHFDPLEIGAPCQEHLASMPSAYTQEEYHSFSQFSASSYESSRAVIRDGLNSSLIAPQGELPATFSTGLNSREQIFSMARSQSRSPSISSVLDDGSFELPPSESENLRLFSWQRFSDIDSEIESLIEALMALCIDDEAVQGYNSGENLPYIFPGAESAVNDAAISPDIMEVDIRSPNLSDFARSVSDIDTDGGTVDGRPDQDNPQPIVHFWQRNIPEGELFGSEQESNAPSTSESEQGKFLFPLDRICYFPGYLKSPSLDWSDPRGHAITAANKLIEDLAPDWIDKVYIPIRRAVLRCAFVEIRRILLKIFTELFPDADMVESYLQQALRYWSSYCRILEMHFIFVWNVICRKLDGFEERLSQAMATPNLGILDPRSEATAWLREDIGADILYLRNQYVHGPTGVLATHRKFGQLLERYAMIAREAGEDISDELRLPTELQPDWPANPNGVPEWRQWQSIPDTPGVPIMPQQVPGAHFTVTESGIDFEAAEFQAEEMMASGALWPHRHPLSTYESFDTESWFFEHYTENGGR